MTLIREKLVMWSIGKNMKSVVKIKKHEGGGVRRERG